MDGKLTGYPSIDKPWLKYYGNNAFDDALNPPKNISVWEYMENALKKQGTQYPAYNYFGKTTSRSDFIKNVYIYASVFQQMGIQEDEVVCYYGPFLPETGYMLFALNMVGATTYFLKLAISKDALAEETNKSRFAIVFDGMWENVKTVFAEGRFEKIIFISAEMSMPFPLRSVIKVKNRKLRHDLLQNSNFIYADALLRKYPIVPVQKAKFKSCRAAFITSSSGTTVGGVVKGTVATNEAVISQIHQSKCSDVGYPAGGLCFQNVPPTASTALCCLFLYGLIYNMTILIDPRLSEEGFYQKVMKYKPQVMIATGSYYEAFFRKVAQKIERGHTPDLRFWVKPIMGGDGCTADDLLWMNCIAKQCNSPTPISVGYGLSEVFSVVSVDRRESDTFLQGKTM